MHYLCGKYGLKLRLVNKPKGLCSSPCTGWFEHTGLDESLVVSSVLSDASDFLVTSLSFCPMIHNMNQIQEVIMKEKSVI